MSGTADHARARREPGPVTSVSVATVTTAIGVLPVFLLAGLAVVIGSELALDERRLGFAVSTFFAVSALAASPAGRFGDAVGPRRGLRIGALLSLVSLLGIGVVSTGYAMLIAFLIVGGVANSISQMAGNVLLIGSSRRERQAISFAFKQSAVPFANLAGGAMVPAVGLTLGWRWAYILTAPLAAIVLVPLPQVSAPASRRDGAIARGPLFTLCVGAALAAGANNATAAFIVISMTRRGIEAGTAGLVLAVGGGVGIVSRLSAGWARDRLGFDGVRGAALLIAGGMFGILTLGWADQLWLLVLGTVVAFGAGWGWTGLITHAVAVSHPDVAGRATGITQSGIFVGGVVGPSAFGLISAQVGFTTAWTVIAVASLCGAVVLLAGGRWLARAGGAGGGVSP